jgi:hypothetical protein
VTTNRSASGVACPLCGDRSRRFDWRPQPWVSFESCPCGGYFVHAAVLDRFTRLGMAERGRVSGRIADLHALKKGAWIMSADGEADGALEVRGERPTE